MLFVTFNLVMTTFLIACMIVLIAGYVPLYYRFTRAIKKEAALHCVQIEQLQSQLAEARLQLLGRQINPFFVKTLHLLSNQLDEEPRTARGVVARLSNILRYAFRETDNDEVTLAQELAILNDYLEIQRIRLGDRFRVKLNIAEDVQEAFVPVLLLIPLVENAIEHVANHQKKEGIVAIRSWREGGELHIRVADSGPAHTSLNGTALQEDMAMRRIQERLDILYGTNQQFSFEKGPFDEGVASLVLPFKHGLIELEENLSPAVLNG